MACLGGGSKISKSSDNIKPPVIEQLSQDDLNAMADKLNEGLNQNNLNPEQRQQVQSIFEMANQKANESQDVNVINAMENAIDNKNIKGIAELFPGEIAKILMPENNEKQANLNKKNSNEITDSENILINGNKIKPSLAKVQLAQEIADSKNGVGNLLEDEINSILQIAASVNEEIAVNDTYWNACKTQFWQYLSFVNKYRTILFISESVAMMLTGFSSFISKQKEVTIY